MTKTDILKRVKFQPTCAAECDYTLSLEGDEVFITFTNGTKMPLRTAKALQRKKRVQEKIRAKRTWKAIWEKENLFSRDDPESEGYNATQSDNGRAVQRLVRAIDAPIRRRLTQDERNRAIVNSAIYLAETLGYRLDSPMYYEILTFISTIAVLQRDAREVLMKRFNLNYHAYIVRLTRYTKLLEGRNK